MQHGRAWSYRGVEGKVKVGRCVEALWDGVVGGEALGRTRRHRRRRHLLCHKLSGVPREQNGRYRIVSVYAESARGPLGRAYFKAPLPSPLRQSSPVRTLAPPGPGPHFAPEHGGALRAHLSPEGGEALTSAPRLDSPLPLPLPLTHSHTFHSSPHAPPSIFHPHFHRPTFPHSPPPVCRLCAVHSVTFGHIYEEWANPGCRVGVGTE